MQTEDTLCYRKYKTEQNKKLELGKGSLVPKAVLESFLSLRRAGSCLFRDLGGSTGSTNFVQKHQ